MKTLTKEEVTMLLNTVTNTIQRNKTTVKKMVDNDREVELVEVYYPNGLSGRYSVINTIANEILYKKSFDNYQEASETFDNLIN